MNLERLKSEQQNKVRIHRFGNSVAFHVSGDQNTETIYLNSEVAFLFGQMLQDFATDCATVPFVTSALQTVEIG